MPFTHVHVKAGKTAEQKQAIARGVHEAMVEAIGIPEDDFFQLLHEYDSANFFFDRRFHHVDRGDDLVVVQMTLRRGRSDAMKRDLYARIARHLREAAGVRPQDVFIYLSENDFSDWSVGGGLMSMGIAQVYEPGAA